MKRVLFLALIALGVSSAVAYALEPDNCRYCVGVYDNKLCESWNGQAHADGQGTILWKVIVPHSFSCDTCPNMHPTGGDECA